MLFAYYFCTLNLQGASCTTFALESFDFAARTAGMFFAHDFCTENSIREPEPRECGTLRRRDCAGRRANHEKTFEEHSRATKARKLARRHSESASTRTNSAEGSPRSRQIRTAPQREHFDTHDLCRGFAAVKTNRTAPQRERFDKHNLRRGKGVRFVSSAYPRQSREVKAQKQS